MHRRVTAKPILHLGGFFREWEITSVSSDFEIRGIYQDWYVMEVSVTPGHVPFALLRNHPRTTNDWSVLDRDYRIITFLSGKPPEMTPIKAKGERLQNLQRLNPEHWISLQGTTFELDRACIYDDSGYSVRSFSVGKGIRHFQTTSAGNVWVTYGEEANYRGNPISEHQFVCFDQDGVPIYRHFETIEHLIEQLKIDDRQILPNLWRQLGILDPYALTIAGEDAWIYPYTRFPLMQIRDQQLHRVITQQQLQGAAAFAIHGEYTLFFGSYEAWMLDSHERLYLFSFETRKHERIIPVDEDNEPIHIDYQDKRLSFGRDSILYFIAGDARHHTLYAIDLRDL